MVEFIETEIPNCFEINFSEHRDARGSFFKLFHSDFYNEKALETNWNEEYFSNSNKNVLRGMHFQTPPVDHSKIVTCLSGSVIDVVVDLRKTSPMYRKNISFELNADSGNKSIYIPSGCAHGFLSLEDNTLMHYKVSTVYSPPNDMGILWSSIGFDWGIDQPILSKRDVEHPKLEDFDSPF